ncbi:MAG: 50S ribosomal protein L3 N(5)-glutamine methyltransferase [Xanthomonadales bacterium]
MIPERTVSDWIERISERFARAGLHFGHGTDNADDEAAWLVLHAAGLPLDGSFDDGARMLSAKTGERIEALARRRCETRKPLAYLTGSAYFAGLEFDVDAHVLVPRSPIAELIEDGFRPWVDPDRVREVLDLCTGSGCIAVAMAVHLPAVRVTASDISAQALAVAARNVSRHAVGDRVELVRSDLFDGLGGRRFDLIVANPPYVPDAGVADLPAEYRAEPGLGLASGADGLDAVLQILLDAPRHLGEDGVLICEVGESEQRLAERLPGVPFLWLDFERGGTGVFLLTRAELEAAAPTVAAELEKRKHVA